MENEYSLIDIIKLLKSRWKMILVWALIVSVFTAGISFLFPNYYGASTTFYAANPALGNPVPLSMSEDRMAVYGNDNDIDRLLAISSSSELLEFLIDSFDLYQHYDIDPQDQKAKFKVREKLLKLYQTQKTKFGGINLSVEDTDPETAAAMANAATDQISNFAQQMIKRAQQKTLDSYLKNISNKSQTLEYLTDSLNHLKSSFEIVDPSSQGEAITQATASIDLELQEAQATLRAMQELKMPVDTINQVKASIAGLVSKQKEARKQLNQFSAGIARVKTLEKQLNVTNDQVSILKERYSHLQEAYHAPFTALHVIEEATVPVVKSRPKRSIFALAAFVLTAVFISIALLFMESFRKVNWD